MIWAKVIGGLVILALTFGAVRWVANTIEKANERDAAVARVAEVEREKADLARTFASAQAGDLAIADELRAFRAEESDRAVEWRKKLGAKPITYEVPRDANPDGTCPPVRVRDPVRYRSLFDEAVGPAYP